MVIQELTDFPLRRNLKSKVEAGDTEDLVGDEYPTCPTLTPNKNTSLDTLENIISFKPYSLQEPQQLRNLIVFQTFISGLSALFSIFGGVSKGPMFQMAPPFWEHSCRGKTNHTCNTSGSRILTHWTMLMPWSCQCGICPTGQPRCMTMA